MSKMILEKFKKLLPSMSPSKYLESIGRLIQKSIINIAISTQKIFAVNLKIYNSDMNLQRVAEVFQNISSSQVISTQEDW